MQQHLDPRCSSFAQPLTMQPCGHDPSIVDDNSIARPQIIRQITDVAMLYFAIAVDYHHSRAVPRRGGAQSDAVLRQFEVE